MPFSADDSIGARSRPATRRAAVAWSALALLLGIGACVVHVFVAPPVLDWQPALAVSEPWRAWTAAWVHYSALHLAANLAGCVLVGALGVVARVPMRIVVAWFVAWPLTQWGLLLQPALLHYGGLSGVLHAGAAAVAIHLIVSARGKPRWVGAGVLAGLAAKVLLEAPWGAPLRHPAGWDIAVVPFAHLCGLVAGATAAALVEAVRRRPLTIDRND